MTTHPAPAVLGRCALAHSASVNTILLDRIVLASLAENSVGGRVWSPEEDQFLRDQLPWMTDAQIGEQLERSENAVHIRWTRELHLPSQFTPAADRWLLRARDELGMTFVHIGRTMKIGAEKKSHKTGTATGNPTIAHRYHWLKAMQKKTRKSRRS